MQLNRLISYVFIFLLSRPAMAQKSFDSLAIQQPKHYFNTVLSLDAYRKPNRNFTAAQPGRNTLGSFGLRQANFFFYTPLRTQTMYSPDSTLQNTHLLLTASVLSLRPVFRDLKTHSLLKAGIGIRFIYNSGKKGLWFFDVSPFMTQDLSFSSRITYRMASTIVYSHNPSPVFNWRIGITKSFQWGNRLYLPFFGLRFGALDKVHFSIQFPRFTSLNFPLEGNACLSLYSMAQGGLYNFANVDSLNPGSKEKTFQFSRYEINHGLRYERRANEKFSFYIAAGISNRNVLSFYSETVNSRRRGLNYTNYFFRTKAVPTLYLNLGLVFKFGQVKSSYKDKNLNDAADLMTLPGGQPINTLQRLVPKTQSALNLDNVQDLVDYTDF